MGNISGAGDEGLAGQGGPPPWPQAGALPINVVAVCHTTFHTVGCLPQDLISPAPWQQTLFFTWAPGPLE